MKKLLIFAAVATMFAACSKDATQDLAVAKPIDKFYATIADNDSRVQLNDACQTVWTAGDRVSVFNKTTGNRRYKFTGNTGDTTGELSYMNGGTTGSAIDKIIAIYPYNASNAVSADGTITTVIPEMQTYCKDSFGVGSSIMIARSETEELSFQNVVGWIRIALTGDQTVKSITLQGYNKEPLAGTATIADDLSVKFDSNATTSVTLDCGEGVKLSTEPTYFYIAVVPQTFSKGYCVEIVDSENKVASLATHKSVTIGRNHILPMTESEYANPQAKPLSNQIWYTTSDGKTITPQSYDGAIVSNTYSNGKGIITFDCAQTSIGYQAFDGYNSLTSITIPDNVTKINFSAFRKCKSLTSVTIPSSVTWIGYQAFNYCDNLTSVYITDIAAWCLIEFIGTFSNPLYYAHNLYLNGKLVTDLVIPNNVVEISTRAFSGCTCLTGVYITDLAQWCSIKFHSNPLSYAHNLYLNGKLVTDLVIPDSITQISDSAFSGCTSLTSVNIPNSVTSIGSSTFSGCTSLTSVNIPNSVTSIGSSAFSGCTSLTSVNIPNSVTSIGSSTFSGCTSLTSVNIPNSVTSIGSSTFSGCTSLTSVNIPNSVTEIGMFAFYGCTGLTNVTIPNSITKINSSVFESCTGLTSIAIPDSVTDIYKYAFEHCINLTSVCITDIAAWCAIKNYGNPLSYAHNLYLNGKLVTHLVIPDSITQISDSAFYGCTSLSSVTIPDSVTSIGGSAFSGCTGLTSVTIPDSVTSIGGSAFSGCTGLTSVTIPDSVNSIGGYAFYNCTGLTSVTIPNSVTSIGGSAFSGCTGLTSVTIPNSVTSIGGSAFSDCTGLTSVTIPNSVNSIGGSAFSDCTGLTSVTIPDSVTSIGSSAFYNCTGLTSIYCKPTTPPNLGSDVFNNIASTAIIYVPQASVNKYKSANGWENYSSKIRGHYL